MKPNKTYLIVLGTMIFSILPNTGNAALTLCQSSANCIANTSFKCCCPTGSTGTLNTCPTGWTYDAFTSLCERSGTTGSDTKGYYTQSYTTCEPTTVTYDCYSGTNTPSGLSCICEQL